MEPRERPTASLHLDKLPGAERAQNRARAGGMGRGGCSLLLISPLILNYGQMKPYITPTAGIDRNGVFPGDWQPRESFPVSWFKVSASRRKGRWCHPHGWTDRLMDTGVATAYVSGTLAPALRDRPSGTPLIPAPRPRVRQPSLVFSYSSPLPAMRNKITFGRCAFARETI